jgi:hypothetical protein
MAQLTPTTGNKSKPDFVDPNNNRKPGQVEKMDGRVRRPGGGPIRFKSFLRNTILTSMQRRGWKEVGEKEEDWDIYWADKEWMASVIFFSSFTNIT